MALVVEEFAQIRHDVTVFIEYPIWHFVSSCLIESHRFCRTIFEELRTSEVTMEGKPESRSTAETITKQKVILREFIYKVT